MGTGAYGRMRPDPEAVERLRRAGVKVEALPTADAVRRYGELDPAPYCGGAPPDLLTLHSDHRVTQDVGPMQLLSRRRFSAVRLARADYVTLGDDQRVCPEWLFSPPTPLQ